MEMTKLSFKTFYVVIVSLFLALNSFYACRKFVVVLCIRILAVILILCRMILSLSYNLQFETCTAVVNPSHNS